MVPLQSTIEYPASSKALWICMICSALRVSITKRRKHAVTLLLLLFRSCKTEMMFPPKRAIMAATPINSPGLSCKSSVTV